MTLSTLKERSTRKDRTDLQWQQQQVKAQPRYTGTVCSSGELKTAGFDKRPHCSQQQKCSPFNCLL